MTRVEFKQGYIETKVDFPLNFVFYFTLLLVLGNGCLLFLK